MKIVAFLVLVGVLVASATVARTPGKSGIKRVPHLNKSLAKAVKNLNVNKYNGYNSGSTVVDFGSAFMALIMAYKNVLPCGYEPWNLPALAPYKVDYYALDSSNENYSVFGYVNNITVTGLNNFNYVKYTYNEANEKLSYDVIFPEIQVVGEYNINLQVNIAGYNISYAGTGVINQKLLDMRAIGGFQFSSPVTAPGLVMNNLNVKFLLGDAVFNNWNNDVDTAVNQFLNSYSNKFLKLALTEMESTINTYYQKLVLPEVNTVIENLSMKSLVDLLLELNGELQMAQCNQN